MYGGDQRTPLNYGSSPYYEKQRPFGMRSKRSTCGVIVMTVFAPFLMFVTAFGFCIMMYQSDVTYLLEALLFLLVLVIIFLAIRERSSSIHGMGYADAYSHWFFLMAALTGLAWVLGVCSGELDYLNNFWPYYYIENMNTYSSIDTGNTSSVQLMDAGIIYFNADQGVSEKNGMIFKSKISYCVAPIVPDDKAWNFSYSFWAVGTDCCTSRYDAYLCATNGTAVSALRIVKQQEKDFYLLAVQQAESWYAISAPQPLFFKVSGDPVGDLSTYLDDGLKVYGYCTAGFLGLVILSSSAYGSLLQSST